MRAELSFEELDGQLVDLLPARETLYFHSNWANLVASNSSLALNAASLFAQAESAAVQTITVQQS